MNLDNFHLAYPSFLSCEKPFEVGCISDTFPVFVFSSAYVRNGDLYCGIYMLCWHGFSFLFWLLPHCIRTSEGWALIGTNDLCGSWYTGPVVTTPLSLSYLHWLSHEIIRIIDWLWYSCLLTLHCNPLEIILDWRLTKAKSLLLKKFITSIIHSMYYS